jgi:hypothetical protein
MWKFYQNIFMIAKDGPVKSMLLPILELTRQASRQAREEILHTRLSGKVVLLFK